MNCNKRVRTYCLADVICADIHTLKSFTIAATSTSVDGYTWGFKEGVCSCSKLFSHIHTHFTWHALSFSPFSINTCQVTGNFICYKVTAYSQNCPTVNQDSFLNFKTRIWISRVTPFSQWNIHLSMLPSSWFYFFIGTWHIIMEQMKSHSGAKRESNRLGRP